MRQQQSLGQLVTEHPTAGEVFYRYGLDFCCGGEEPLSNACHSKGLDPMTVLHEIEENENLDTEDDIQWDQRPVSELIQHILDRYHAPLRIELPRLIELASKVEWTHQDRSECPIGLAEHLSQAQIAVEEHLAKEEQILFPLFLNEGGGVPHMPIQIMIQEHEDHGQSLQRIRQLTHDFKLPEDACQSWRELYRSLERFEFDLMTHIHLENHVLFPNG